MLYPWLIVFTNQLIACFEDREPHCSPIATDNLVLPAATISGEQTTD
jgi:hypothetical protein